MNESSLTQTMMAKRTPGAPGAKRKKTAFRLAAERKGWAMKEIAERWQITPLSLSRQTREPDQKAWDALEGLPDKAANTKDNDD